MVMKSLSYNRNTTLQMHNINNIETIGWQLYPARAVRFVAAIVAAWLLMNRRCVTVTDPLIEADQVDQFNTVTKVLVVENNYCCDCHR